MGSFFVTNDTNVLTQTVDRMTKKGLTRLDNLKAKDITILNFKKKFISDHENLYRNGEDFVVGCGTYFFEGKFARNALKAIYNSLVKSQIPWAEVNGHCSFASYVGGNISIVTDKGGMHHVYVGRDGEKFYISTSQFAVAQALPNLTVSPQECLEFLYTQGTYGNRTIFEEITQLEAGCVFEIDPASQKNDSFASKKRYYRPTHESVTTDAYVEAARAYFEPFKEPDFSFSCDLSGGYDSRTVAALLEHSDCAPEYNTNTNPTDPTDHAVAIELAESVHRSIRVFERNITVPFTALVDRCFIELELCRDVFGAHYSPVLFSKKAESADLIIGGYGGELLRDKYSRFKSLPEMIRAGYTDAGFKLAPKVLADYLDALESKFVTALAPYGTPDIRTSVETVYYLEKMRNWGGSRITAFNQYCYRLHPLLDDTLAKYSFGFSLAEKEKAKLQRRLITMTSPTLARVRSSYMGKSMFLKDGDSDTPKGDYAALLGARSVYGFRKIVKTLRNLSVLSGSRTEDYLTVFESKGYLSKLLGIRFDDVFNMKMRGRYLTLEKTIHAFRNKIDRI